MNKGMILFRSKRICTNLVQIGTMILIIQIGNLIQIVELLDERNEE